MNRKLKLIWDFKGPASQKTVEHHCIHLKEYAKTEQLHYYEINVNFFSENKSNLIKWAAIPLAIYSQSPVLQE